LYKEGIFDLKPNAELVGCPNFGRMAGYNDLYLENTERACYLESVWLTQNMLLGSKNDMDDIADAVQKVMENIGEIAG